MGSELLEVQNFCSFQKCHFWNFFEIVGDDANSVFHEDQKIFQSVTFEIFGKCSESVNFDANNDLQEDLKIFKSDTFENYKSFVPVEVQSLYV